MSNFIYLHSKNFFAYTDVDECATWIDDCHDYATCNNTMGNFECTCDEGFNGDGKNCTGEYESLHSLLC